MLTGSTLGIDFGTSNSAAAIRLRAGDKARLLTLEPGSSVIPTALFFNGETSQTHYGRDAVRHYLEGFDGRLMRSLKSLLGSALLQDKTSVHNKLVSYQDIIAMFLRRLAERVQSELGEMPERVVIGRPVHFVDGDAVRDRLAEDALREAAAQAGFAAVNFQFEPIAAALDYEQRLSEETLVLVVDIGGGTSDFTVVRLGPERVSAYDRSKDVLSTSGVHIGGTDFDRKLNLEQVMPLLGFRHRGPHGREVPSRVFFDLATWHLIPWQYSAKSMRDAQQLRGDYSKPVLHDRLMSVLNERWGHRLANEVEQAKIAASQQGASAPIALDWLDGGLGVAITPEDLAQHLHASLAQVAECAQECLRLAGVTHHDIGAIYLTGGSSALRALRDALGTAFPGTPQVEGDLFGGVATGLAYSQG
ncbi:MAG: Hsp70 family protein [Comamonadaceae bacterium]|nr:MAG: Hsp70 family protein [Comamonadaceae bacterium]